MQEIIELPKNVELYRGTNKPNNFKRNDPVYFLYGNNGYMKAMNAYTSTKRPDSNVFTFKTSRCVKLLNMGNPNVIKKLLHIFSDNKTIIYALEKAFIIENNKVLRYSKKGSDLIVAKAICLLDVDGYVSPKLPRTDSSRLFHQEIVLCNAKNKVIAQTHSTRPKTVKSTESIRPTHIVKMLNNNSNNNVQINNYDSNN